MPFRVTERLREATEAVAAQGAFRNVDRTRLGLVDDIQSRARELLAMRVGQSLEAWQVEYLQCLRQRLQDFCVASFVVSQDWEDAFCDAYSKRKED